METSLTLVHKVWKDNIESPGFCGIVDEWFAKIIAQYNGEARKYHNLHHLETKLQHFIDVQTKIKNKTAFVLALYFQ